MAWKEVNTSGRTDAIDIKKLGAGKVYTGIFIGSRTIKTKLGDQVIWQFTDEANDALEIFGFSMLNSMLKTMNEGTPCRITYLGKKNVKTKFGLKDVHQVRVEYNDGNNEKAMPDINEVPF